MLATDIAMEKRGNVEPGGSNPFPDIYVICFIHPIGSSEGCARKWEAASADLGEHGSLNSFVNHPSTVGKVSC